MHLDIEVAKLRMIKSSWVNEQVKLKENVSTHYPQRIEELTNRKESLEIDYKSVEEYTREEFMIELDGKMFTERKEAAIELEQLAFQSSFKHEKIGIGTYKGFQLKIEPSLLGGYSLEAKGSALHKINVYVDRGIGNIQKLENTLERIPRGITSIEQEIEGIHKQIHQAKEQINVPFQYEEKLDTMLKRQNEINLAIEMGIDTEKTVETKEEQSQDGQEAMVTISLPTRSGVNDVKQNGLER